MKITRLEIFDFKKIVAVDIRPDGSTVTISGGNGAGKSSCLDAIEAALGGTRRSPAEPIRQGQKKARVVVETEELVVTRTFTAKGSQLEVKAKDWSTYASPQAMLDALVGPVSFDPISFARQEAKEQAATLRALVGLDFTKEDGERLVKFNERTDVGRELRRLHGAVDKMPEAPPGTPDAEVVMSEIVSEIDKRQRENASNAAKRATLDAMRREGVVLARSVDDAKEKLAQLEAALAGLRETGVALRAEVDQLIDQDVGELRGRMANAEAVNAAVRLKATRANLCAEIDALTDKSEALTKYIEQIDEVKASAAASAKYPIPGLAVTDAGVQLDGVPFEQASQAQKLRASIAIGLALNPKLRVLLVRDAAVLDEASTAMVASMAEEAGAQVWLEKIVHDGGGMSVVIEDGHVSCDASTVGGQP